MKYFLAIDIGASSGRHIIACHDDTGNTEYEEIYRFSNSALLVDGHLIWDIETIFKEIKNGIKIAFEKYGKIESLSIDTWGVDYVLVNGDETIFPAYSYRDTRTDEVIEKLHSIIPFETLYEHTGCQFQPFTTIYQLFSDTRLENATDFLMIPEYFMFRLTGVKKKEFTNATTTGLINAQTLKFDEEIIEKLGFPKRLFSDLYMPETVVGKLKDDISSEVGGQCDVILCATHDTASAVEGIPMEQNNLYISSGTWSLLGVKTPAIITDKASMEANFSNEGGCGYNRYQKNIMGLWLVQCLKKELCPEKDFNEITDDAEKSLYDYYPDINHQDFISPSSMKEVFCSHLASKGYPLPKNVGDFFRSAYSGLASCYKDAISELESNLNKSFDELYIVGGGAKNGFLNSLTEQFTRKKVIALPIEATALGNLKIQMKAKGY